MSLVFKIMLAREWAEFETDGVFAGSAVDRSDGFIHLSYPAQVAETAARHFAGMEGLVLVAIDRSAVAGALRDEVSRGGALFPHLFAPIRQADVVWTRPIALGADGVPIIPALGTEMGEDER